MVNFASFGDFGRIKGMYVITLFPKQSNLSPNRGPGRIVSDKFENQQARARMAIFGYGSYMRARRACDKSLYTRNALIDHGSPDLRKRLIYN